MFVWRNILAQWHKIKDAGITPSLGSRATRRVRLLNQVAVIGAIFFLPYIFQYFGFAAWLPLALQCTTVLGMVGVWALNHHRQYLLARYLLVVVCSLNLVVNGTYFGLGSGEHLGFMVLFMAIPLIFEVRNEPLHFWIGLLIPGLSLLLSVWGLEAEGPPTIALGTYLFNLVVTIIISILVGMYFVEFSDQETRAIQEQGREQLRAAFDHSPNAVLLIEGRSSRIMQSNQRASNLLALPQPERLVGNLLADYHVPHLSQYDLNRIRPQMDREGQFSQEVYFRCSQRGGFWGEIRFSYFTYQAEELVMIQVSDISQRRQQQMELIKAKERAQQATIAKSHFLANMSHELRTPINGIMGLTELMLEEASAEVVDEFAPGILQSGERLLRTISLVLDLARLEAEAVDLQVLSVDLQELIHRLGAEFGPQAQRKGLAFEVDNLPQGSWVAADPAMLGEALRHLIDNAIKFTQAGEIKLQTSPHTHEGRPGFCIEVSDTGIGMSQEFIEHGLFERFQQESVGMDRHYEGAGLGLSITKRIVELMEGRISVDSNLGSGSRFSLWLPANLKIEPSN